MTKKLYALIVCIAMLIVSVASVPAHAIAANYVSFTDKIIFENEIYSASDYSTLALNEQEIPESVSVTLRFEESFTCEHESFDNFDQVLEHRAELKEYYSGLNPKLVRAFSLTDYESMSFSDYGPFIEYVYPTYDDFMEADYDTLAAKNPAEMTHVYIRSDYAPEECATIGTTTQEYPFSQALSDVGIPTNNTYDGTGIKVGVLELNIPINKSNLNAVDAQRDMYGVEPGINPETGEIDDHAFWVYSVLGGTTGVAKGVNLYFAGTEGSSFYTRCNDLLDLDVNIINTSAHYGLGSYDSIAAFADYIVQNTKVTYVASASNQRNEATNQYLLGSPSVGANIISVASNDVDKKISKFSSYLLNAEWRDILLKPTLTAPGGLLSEIADNLPDAISGTSFSAPIVSGIVALLMEQFPTLKWQPERVMSVLTATCTPATGQNNMVDADAGFGIVNYTRARQALQNSYGTTFSIPEYATAGTVLKYATVVVPANSVLTITANVMYNSGQSDPSLSGPLAVPDFTELHIAVSDETSYVISGNRKSNFAYSTVVNNNSYAKQYKITVKVYADKTTSATEYGSYSYYIDSTNHAHSYTHAYHTPTATSHRSCCSCGGYINENHTFQQSNGAMICQYCGYSIQIAK